MIYNFVETYQGIFEGGNPENREVWCCSKGGGGDDEIQPVKESIIETPEPPAETEPVKVCGDGKCDDTETCKTCVEDCGCKGDVPVCNTKTQKCVECSPDTHDRCELNEFCDESGKCQALNPNNCQKIDNHKKHPKSEGTLVKIDGETKYCDGKGKVVSCTKKEHCTGNKKCTAGNCGGGEKGILRDIYDNTVDKLPSLDDLKLDEFFLAE